MTSPQAEAPERPYACGRWAPFVDALLLAAAAFLVYANAYDHAFQLDSLHTILDNPAVRSLDSLGAFFTDLGTASTLPSNSDYRPVLMVSYALNYAWAEYAMPVWHATQIALHALCALGLYFLVGRLGRTTALPPVALRWTALSAALVFVVHPTGAGVVDYLAARSSLLAAAFSWLAILGYLGLPDRRQRRWSYALAVVAFGLALFTKVEAIACLGVFVLCDAHERARSERASGAFLTDLIGVARQSAVRLVPFALVAGAYFVARTTVMADSPFSESSRLEGVGRWDYLLTQTTAWWSYVAHAFWPSGLVADHSTFPVRRSLFDPVVLAAIVGWLAVVVLCWRAWARRPYLMVAAAGALALISPTSSIVPLAEMVNEHRPYLPISFLSCAWMLLLAELVQGAAWTRRSALALVGVVLVPLSLATWQRNKVFATEATYWQDVLAKAPSARAHTNYARTLMASKNYEAAGVELKAALELAPNWYITHVNLGVVERELGQLERAAWHFDRAVELDLYTATALFWRAEFALTQARYQVAHDDFVQTLELGREPFRSYKGLATAAAGLGDAQTASASFERCLDLDRPRAELAIKEIAGPFFEARERFAAGVEFFEALRARLPETWWVHENIGNLCQQLGRTAEAQAALAESRRLRGLE